MVSICPHSLINSLAALRLIGTVQLTFRAVHWQHCVGRHIHNSRQACDVIFTHLGMWLRRAPCTSRDAYAHIYGCFLLVLFQMLVNFFFAVSFNSMFSSITVKHQSIEDSWFYTLFSGLDWQALFDEWYVMMACYGGAERSTCG